MEYNRVTSVSESTGITGCGEHPCSWQGSAAANDFNEFQSRGNVVVGQRAGLGLSECYGSVTVAVAVSSVSFERVTVQECLSCGVRAGVDRDCYTAGNRVAFKGEQEVVRCG